ETARRSAVRKCTRLVEYPPLPSGRARSLPVSASQRRRPSGPALANTFPSEEKATESNQRQPNSLAPFLWVACATQVLTSFPPGSGTSVRLPVASIAARRLPSPLTSNATGSARRQAGHLPPSRAASRARRRSAASVPEAIQFGAVGQRPGPRLAVGAAAPQHL